MSEVRVDHDGPSTESQVDTGCEASRPDLESLLPAGSSSADISPSPSEPDGLLSLPWEILAQIASHLPAQCVVNVLPKVCHALGTVAKDSTAWQLRARRIIGSKAGFPAGPKEDFDWPTACMEMEQLITCWRDDAYSAVRQIQEEEIERGRQQRPGPDVEGAAGGGPRASPHQEDNREDGAEGAGLAAREAAFPAEEVMDVAVEGEDGEIQPVADRDQVAGRRDDAAELMEEERNHRLVFDAPGGADLLLNLREDLADLRNLGNERQVEVTQHPSPKSPSPSPALECMTLPSGHIAQVNSVLLLGGEGKVCATASRDWNVKLWDLQVGPSGSMMRSLVGPGDFCTHRGWVWCLASRGPLLASGGFDSTVRLWDLQAGGAPRGLIRAGAAVLCLSWDTDVLLAGTFDKKVTMYDSRAADPFVKSFSLHSNAVMCLAADDKYIVSGSKDCTVAVYDRRAGKDLKKVRLKSYLLSMSYSGSEVWAGDNCGTLHSFSMQAGRIKPLSKFDVGHSSLITGIHKSSGSLYTCSADGTVKVHIPSAPPRTLCTLHHQSGVHGLSVEADVLAVASGEVNVEVWRPRK